MRLRLLLVVAVLLCAACGAPAATPPPTSPPEVARTEEWVDQTDEAAVPAPDFTAASLEGERYTLSGLRGQWVLLNFWATWCAPCAAEMPTLQQLADTYAGELTVLGVNLRETADTVAPFVAEHGLRFPILINPDDSLLLNYQVIGLPQTLLISPAGDIVYRQFGPLEFDQFAPELQQYMERGAAT